MTLQKETLRAGEQRREHEETLSINPTRLQRVAQQPVCRYVGFPCIMHKAQRCAGASNTISKAAPSLAVKRLFACPDFGAGCGTPQLAITTVMGKVPSPVRAATLLYWRFEHLAHPYTRQIVEGGSLTRKGV